MELESSWLLGQIKADMKATSERQHRDARRQHALRAASLALGTGLSAAVVKARLTDAGLILRPARQRPVVREVGS
jgi:hypothetical protein